MDNTNLDVDELLHALDNENNSSIINLTTTKIKSAKNDVLQKLQLPREKLKELHTKLAEYRVVNDIDDIEYGRYIRWISLKNPSNIKLTNGGILCDIKVNEQVSLLCKNNTNRFFQIKMDECIIFQKLTEQEKIILSVINYLK